MRLFSNVSLSVETGGGVVHVASSAGACVVCRRHHTRAYGHSGKRCLGVAEEVCEQCIIISQCRWDYVLTLHVNCSKQGHDLATKRSTSRF